MTNQRTNRYPGVKPFEASEQAQFFGRERDIADLLALVKTEQLAVLFGKSGYGKSSILNAGVLPRLRGTMTPIEVRFGEYIEGQSLAPAEAVRRKSPLPKKASGPLAEFFSKTGNSLWAHFRQLDVAETGSFLLVFDQFEEFFSYPPAQQAEFRQQLAELLDSQLPESAATLARSLDREQRRQLAAPLDIRVLLAIRSDRLHELDRLKDQLPAILHKRYELKALTREQAREAIVGPAALASTPILQNRGTDADTGAGAAILQNRGTDTFASPPFEYREDALQHILADLTKSNTAQQTGVEAFQLQILCDSIESKVAAGLVADRDGNGLPDVTADDLPDFNQVYGEYYERRLAHLPAEHRAAARQAIEDELVRWNPETDEKRRLSVDADTLRNRGLPTELLRALEQTYLVRREPNTLGGYNYELCHDTLLDPVVRAKKERLLAEAAEAQALADKLERERLEREAERQRLEQEKIRRARNRAIAVAAGAVALLIWALFQTNEARNAKNLAEAAYKIAVKNLLQIANDRIYHLQYDSAAVLIFEASRLEVEKPSVVSAVMEIAFWKTETGDFSAAETALRTAAKLLGKSAFDIHQKSAQGKRTELLAAIETLDNDRLAQLRARYYPSMLKLPGGNFLMGCNNTKDKCNSCEVPVHTTYLTPFSMARTETTNWQYGLCLAATGRDIHTENKTSWELDGNNPAIKVSWYDAVVFANWQSARQGLTPAYSIDSVGRTQGDGWKVEPIADANGFRLPTEAEWEFAVRGGDASSMTKYAGSDSLDLVAWFWKNSDSRTHPVALKKANGFGLFDMSGNVWEWCWDWYDDNYYERVRRSAAENPTGAESGSLRVVRGGSWFNFSSICRSAYRGRIHPVEHYYLIGFRVAGH